MLGKIQKNLLNKHREDGIEATWIENNICLPCWPFLQKLVEKESLHFFDFSLAERLWRFMEPFDESVAALICYLSAALCARHTYVQIKAECFFPDLQELCVLLTKDEILRFKELILQGIKQVPSSLLTKLEPDQEEDVQTPLCQQGSLFFFQKYKYNLKSGE